MVHGGSRQGWRRIGALCALLALLAFSACGDDDGGGDAVPLGAAEPMRALLSTLPASGLSAEPGATVYLADFEAARSQLGIEAPGPDAGSDAFFDYAKALVVARRHAHDVERVDGTHRLGEATRLAIADERLVRTRATAELEATLDTLDGGASLADDDTLASLAAGLDRADARAGVLVPNVEDFTIDGALGARATPEQVEALEKDTPTLAPYEALAVGTAFAGDGADEPLMVVALAHPDAGAAKDNAERFEEIVNHGLSLQTREPWADRLEIDSVEADGTLVVARLKTEIPAFWLQPVARRESLFLHDRRSGSRATRGGAPRVRR